ncbi:TonB-dependent receptor [Sinimarinibacterium sp. NLF-5-8]|uniref:TonB-dependent receptor n=1 Tax=Sinimarinibacterium sp. NLF-5-8 TaxID=2698684 RepID=UPI001EE41B6E|nr:TonB-dependent receptor [Sinimarinibacterium sp. NLF-5-8]
MQPSKMFLMQPLAVAAALMLSPLSQAQEATSAPTPASQKGASKIEDMVVTAQRREERLQDVPVAVSALSTDQIESRGITNLGDLNALAPGLQISNMPTNTTSSQVTVRGVSQINPAITWDPAVGIYVDGVYIGKAQGSIFDVVDLDRVEVLRGPQGTLYGRNTLAGAINLVTRAPTGTFGGSAAFDVGNYNLRRQRVSVDLPQWGIARISIAARSEQRDGWIDTTPDSPVPEFNNRNNSAFRIAADFDLAPDLVAEYRFDRSNVNQTNNYSQLVRLDPVGAMAPGAGNPFWDSVSPFVDRERQDHAQVDAPSGEHLSINGHALTFNYDMDSNTTVKSISGYRQMKWNDSLDLDGSPTPLAWTQRLTDYEQFSQDLQVLGNYDQWNYVAGIYYFADNGNTNNPQQFFAGAANFDSRYGTKTGAWAGYGQLDFRPIERLTLSAGVRYTREKKQLDRAFGVLDPASGALLLPLIPEGTHAEETFSATTPMGAIAWKFSDNINAYFRYAEGFKSGGFNGEFSQAPTGTETPQEIADLIQLHNDETVRPYRPEKQRSYELGLKTAFADNRAQFNLALFQNKLKDFQASIFLGQGAAATMVRNAGRTTMRGVEVEFAVVPFSGTRLSANYAYLDAKYDEFMDGGVNVADDRAIPHAPEHSFNIVLDSELLRRDWGTVRAVADYAWTDRFYTFAYQISGDCSADPTPRSQVAGCTQVPAHGLLNLRLGVTDIPLSRGSTAEIALWARNVLDDDSPVNFIDFGYGFGNLTVANFEEPRTFGISGIVRW